MATRIKTQKRLAAKILNCGESRIWIDPEAVGEVATAMTSGDIRKYIGLGFIQLRDAHFVSRGRLRKRILQEKKGRRRGQGSRKGRKHARLPRKTSWITRIRSQRSLLKELRANGNIDRKTYRKLYMMLKAGIFKSKAHLKVHLNEKGISLKRKIKTGKKKLPSGNLPAGVKK